MNSCEKIYNKRKRITDKILKVPTDILFKFKVCPNIITMLSALSIIISSYFIHYYEFIQAIALLLLSIIFDLLDGSLARRYKFNKHGFVIDSLSDHCFASLLIISLYSIGMISFELMLISVASIFFLVINHVYQKLSFKKEVYALTLSISITTILSLIFSQLSTFLVSLMAAINILNGAILFKKISFIK